MNRISLWLIRLAIFSAVMAVITSFIGLAATLAGV